MPWKHVADDLMMIWKLPMWIWCKAYKYTCIISRMYTCMYIHVSLALRDSARESSQATARYKAIGKQPHPPWQLHSQARNTQPHISCRRWCVHVKIYKNSPRLHLMAYALPLNVHWSAISEKTKSEAPEKITMQFRPFPLKNQSNNGLQAKSWINIKSDHFSIKNQSPNQLWNSRLNLH